MRAIVIGDDDDLVGKMDGSHAELLISVGDLWESTISRAQREYRSNKVFAVKGNHDSPEPFGSGIADLHLKIETFGGIRFGGFCGSWRFKPRGHYLFEQYDVSEALETFPEVDVFVAHNSPAGYHERDLIVHQGFEAFTRYIDRARPAYFLHGHQHLNRNSFRNETLIAGVFGKVVIELDLGG